MFVKPFRYERAGSLGEACDLLRASAGGAKVIAGGQSFLPMMNLGLLDPDTVIDIGAIDGIRGVTEDGGYLEIGALARHRDLERDPLIASRQPLLAEAARWVGSPRIRTRGTLGGSLAHSDPAAELPLVMTAIGAGYRLTDGTTERVVRADEFHVSYFTNALGEDELLASVRVPTLGPGWGWGFAEVARRKGDFALVAAAALARVADGRVIEARLALAGVGERATRIGAIESALTGAAVTDLDERIGAVEGIEPASDTMASAEHRRHLARVLTIRAVSDAIARGGETT